MSRWQAMGVVPVVFAGAAFGFFYAWVCSTLWGLDTLAPQAAIDAMNAMNESVRNPVFFTGFFLTPVVALVQPDYTMTLNPHEVADAFEVPLDFLMDPANHRRHAVEWAGSTREWFSMPYQDAIAERFIWGATAGMLRNFYRFLVA